ncbi:unnamed protein product [Urochloa humidicola]
MDEEKSRGRRNDCRRSGLLRREERKGGGGGGGGGWGGEESRCGSRAVERYGHTGRPARMPRAPACERSQPRSSRGRTAAASTARCQFSPGPNVVLLQQQVHMWAMTIQARPRATRWHPPTHTTAAGGGCPARWRA